MPTVTIEIPLWMALPAVLVQIGSAVGIVAVVIQRIQEKRKGELDAYRDY